MSIQKKHPADYHDIGLMAAFAYTAQYPAEVKKLALLDAVLPGIEPMWNESSV